MFLISRIKRKVCIENKLSVALKYNNIEGGCTFECLLFIATMNIFNVLDPVAQSRTNSGHKIPIKSAGGSVVQGDGRLHLRYCYYFIGWEDQGFSCLSLLRNLKYRAMSTSSHPLCKYESLFSAQLMLFQV